MNNNRPGIGRNQQKLILILKNHGGSMQSDDARAIFGIGMSRRSMISRFREALVSCVERGFMVNNNGQLSLAESIGAVIVPQSPHEKDSIQSYVNKFDSSQTGAVLFKNNKPIPLGDRISIAFHNASVDPHQRKTILPDVFTDHERAYISVLFDFLQEHHLSVISDLLPVENDVPF